MHFLTTAPAGRCVQSPHVESRTSPGLYGFYALSCLRGCVRYLACFLHPVPCSGTFPGLPSPMVRQRCDAAALSLQVCGVLRQLASVQLLALQSRTLRHQLGAGSAPSTPSDTARSPGMSQTARLPPVRVAAFRGFRVTSPPWLAIPRHQPTPIEASGDAEDNLPR
jgi:hypothetical protein